VPGERLPTSISTTGSAGCTVGRKRSGGEPGGALGRVHHQWRSAHRSIAPCFHNGPRPSTCESCRSVGLNSLRPEGGSWFAELLLTPYEDDLYAEEEYRARSMTSTKRESRLHGLSGKWGRPGRRRFGVRMTPPRTSHQSSWPTRSPKRWEHRWGRPLRSYVTRAPGRWQQTRCNGVATLAVFAGSSGLAARVAASRSDVSRESQTLQVDRRARRASIPRSPP
jgi:hypothetical protein